MKKYALICALALFTLACSSTDEEKIEMDTETASETTANIDVNSELIHQESFFNYNEPEKYVLIIDEPNSVVEAQ